MARVLLLDDDGLVLGVVADLLASAGHDVTAVQNATEALACLATDAVDILITDIRMPGPLNGWEIAEIARERRPHLPIIYVSGFSTSPVRSVPGSTYLHKPFSIETLTAAVTKAMSTAA